MTKIVLKALKRASVGKKVKNDRAAGQFPAVVYGHGVAPRSLWMSLLDFTKAYRNAGESTIVELRTEGEQSVNVLIHDVQIDAMTGRFTHADLLQVRMNEAIEAHVPIEFVGEAPAVKTLGGMFLKSVDEVTVHCLPADLPHAITVDISVLKEFDNHITVRDLNVSSKVKIMNDEDMVIAGVTPPRTTAEIADLNTKAEADVTKVEGVIKDTKAE